MVAQYVISEQFLQFLIRIAWRVNLNFRRSTTSIEDGKYTDVCMGVQLHCARRGVNYMFCTWLETYLKH